MNRFISYEGLPINSGGAHSVSRKSPQINYTKTLDFLNLFAYKINSKSINLTLNELDKKLYTSLKLVFKFILKFGIPKIRYDGLLKTWTWNLNEKHINKGFEALNLNNKLSKNPVGPITLSFNWNFNFKDPKTNKVLPNQELIPQLDFRIKNSRIYLRLSKESTISVWFAFPFEKMEEYELEFVKELKSNLPFRTSDKHWRIWRKAETGNWVPKKIEMKKLANEVYVK